MWAILFIIGGIILQFNEQWFNGAGTVGWVLIGLGSLALVLWLVVSVLALSTVNDTRREFKRTRW